MVSVVTPRMVTVMQSSRKLASSFGLPQNGLACTMLMRLYFISKFTSPTSTLGPVATLAAEGTEKSRRVFSAMSSVIDGAWEVGSLVDCEIGGGTTRGRTLLTSFSGFSTKFVGKEKPDIHYPVFIQSGENKKINTLACISSSYLLLILPCLCTLVNNFTPSAIPGNGARNACWHFLASPLGVVSS